MNDLYKKTQKLMDLSDDIRETLLDMLSLCDNIEGTDDIRELINKCATPMVNINSALEDILLEIEDHKDED